MIPGKSRLRISSHLFRSKQVILAFLIAAAFGLGLVGCGPLSKSPTPTPLLLVEVAPGPTSVGLATATPFSGMELTAMPSPETPIPATPTATPCGPPDYWAAYVVQAGDTLFSLAAKTQTSVVQIRRANCLDSDDLVVGQSLYLPFVPTPTACGPPANWAVYVVQAGDTLFSLAAKTQASVEQVKRANCLVGDDLVVGQSLYLPSIPAPPTPIPQPAWLTPIPQPAWPTPIAQPVQPTPIAQPVQPTPIPKPALIAAADCSSPFSCRNPELEPCEMPVGGPNDPDFKPCEEEKGRPWISVETEGQGSNDLQHGQRAYYFACEFPDPDTLTARMTGPGGPQTLDARFAMFNPDLKTHHAQRVVTWNVTCDLPTGEYTLTLEDEKGGKDQLTFKLENTTREWILTVPQSGPPGTTFQVYYCGYKDRAGQDVVIDFYYEVARLPDRGYEFGHWRKWSVTINASGWARQEFSSSCDDPARAYMLRDRDDVLKGWDQFWLIR